VRFAQSISPRPEQGIRRIADRRFRELRAGLGRATTWNG
jgi:hypothetical protein